MAKGLGNNPLAPAYSSVQDELIRKTESVTPVTTTAKPVVSAAKMIPKSIQLDSLLNERLRRYAFESRTKEAQIIRDALHAWLAQQGF